jgi:GNAT superfamily N-acetyltransferase
MPNMSLSGGATETARGRAMAFPVLPSWPPHRLRLRDGAVATVEFVTARDGAELQDYFVSLSPRARYNRFAGASSGLSDRELDVLLRVGEHDRFAVIIRIADRNSSAIVGEARYALDQSAGSLEFSLSVSDAFRGRGIGLAMLLNLECRARILGAKTMFGDTLRTNDEMQGLARKAGFWFAATPGDWREIRLVKTVGGCCGAQLTVAASRHAGHRPVVLS